MPTVEVIRRANLGKGKSPPGLSVDIIRFRCGHSAKQSLGFADLVLVQRIVGRSQYELPIAITG